MRRVLQIGVAALLVLGVGGFFGYRWMQSRRYDTAIRDTEDFLRSGDPRSAAFAAKRAARLRDDSVVAARLLAEALEKTGSVEAVLWRKKVVDLAAGDWRDHLAFATTAMRFRDAKLASTALEKVDAAGRQHIDFHRTAADIALALEKKDDAETHLAEVVRLDPYDRARQLQLAVLRLGATDAAISAAARTQLEQVKDDPQFRLVALRVLVRDATRTNATPSLRLALSSAAPLTQAALADDPRLAALALELLAEPEATVDDCLLSLEALRLMQHPELREKVARLETAKSANPADLGDAMLWLNSRGFVQRTPEWIERLSAEVRSTPEVQLGLLDARMILRDHAGAQAVTEVEGADWGNFEADRLVASAIVWRQLDNRQRADAAWNLAEIRMQQNVPRLKRLAELCTRWGAEPEREKLWWALASCPGDQNDVLKKLFGLSVKRKDSAGLFRAVKGIYQLNPDEPPAMNNYAWMSLLRNEDLDTAHLLAERVHQANPAIGAYASTYAFSLHVRGRTAEALKVMEALPRQALSDAVVAGCYGFMLRATGQREKGEEYLGVARRSPDLLPEEARLFLGDRQRIDRSLEVPELRIFSAQPGGRG